MAKRYFFNGLNIIKMDKFEQHVEIMKRLRDVYDAHKTKLNNLKENRSKAYEEKWTDAEIKSVDDQIRILASVLSDLYRDVLQISVWQSLPSCIYSNDDIDKAYKCGERQSTFYKKDGTVILPRNYEGVDG